MKTQEALKLALEALKDYKRNDDDRVSIAMGILQDALAEQPAPSSHLTDEQKAANGLAWLARLEAMREEFAGLAEQPAQQRHISYVCPQCYWSLEEQPAPVAEPHKQHDCSRSHPHENMDAMCELRTEIARLTNENARLKAKQQSDEVNAYRMTLLCIRDGLQQGMSKSIQKLQAREINDVLGMPSFASYRTSPPASKPEQQEPVSGVVIREGLPALLQDRNIKPTDQRLYTSPQPAQQQEPVARVIDDGTSEGSTEWIPFANRMEPLEAGDLLYTSPPASKPWVGLDDTDLDVCDTDGRLLARYWERVLREKNA